MENEEIPKYIERFSSMVYRFQNVVSASQDGAESQKFSIELLNIAKVSDQTFSNLIRSLINNEKHRESRKKNCYCRNQGPNNYGTFCANLVGEKTMELRQLKHAKLHCRLDWSCPRPIKTVLRTSS